MSVEGRDGQLSVRRIFDARVPMRDGVELSADIYLPGAEGRYPTIVTRTPYDNANRECTDAARFLAQNGYVFVSCDVRGRGDSDGRFSPFRGEGKDGYDTIEWAASQPWCDGQVGMMGASYACSTQWWTALEQPPHLVTLVSTAVSGRLVQSPQLRGKIHLQFLPWLHRTGGRSMQPGLDPADDIGIDWERILTHRPLRDAADAMAFYGRAWGDWLDHSSEVDYWMDDLHFRDYSRVALPVLHITGWYDGSLVGELELFDGMRRDSSARDQQYLVVGPWDHGGTRTPTSSLDHVDFGSAALIHVDELHLRWFNHWMKKTRDPEFESDQRVHTFTMGKNEWRVDETWPPAGTTQRIFYLHSNGSANSREGDGRLDTEAPRDDEPMDGYSYDPSDPTPSAPNLASFVMKAGPLDYLDRAYVESRSDVLVYTTEALDADLQIAGAPLVRLWAATDMPDTDFAAALCDVDPTGRSTILAEALIRASYRTGRGRHEPVRQDTVVLYELALNPTSILLPRGHRLRLEIMSAEFPAYDRNPNTGRSVGDDVEMSIATQQIWHAGTSCSHIALPVVAS